MIRRLLLLAALAPALSAGPSVFTHRPDDPAAVYVTAENFAVKADGMADDTAVLQAAINRVQETTRRGIVFIPSGRYRLTSALLVWSGIRLIGYGPTRPVFVLGENTPGYQEGERKYLVHFVSERPASPGQPVRDANPGTFYSAMSNLDIEIRDGNPAAVGVRSHFAQHGFLSHMDFHIGQGRAGVEEVGNESSHLRFFGGEFGITTHKPSPSWPFVLLDTHFEGQRRAAIETEEGGLTLIRLSVKNTPTALLVRPDRCEELWLEDSRFENLSGPALVISDETSARTWINVRNLSCVNVPEFAHFRESGRSVEGKGTRYVVKEFSHGLHLDDLGANPAIRTTWDATAVAAVPAPVPSDLIPLPPMAEWVNLRTLGAKGDGEIDDTAALRSAIAQHRVIYLPTGRYRVTDTITLRPDTVLIGLNPITTQILIHDYTPAFQSPDAPPGPPAPPTNPRWGIPPSFPGTAAPMALIEAPAGGLNLVNGLGLDTGGVNNRAVGLKWMAGEKSNVNDVRFLGGHGTYGPDGVYLRIYNDTRSGDPDSRRRWDSQHASLWVTAGGGGVFKGIWTPSPYSSAGLFVSDTATRGRVYALSSEHHVRTEVKLRNVANWSFYALQTEAERHESPRMLPLEIESSSDLLFANFFIYRVDTPIPYETGIRLADSRRLQFRGVHVYSPGKLSYDNTLVDRTTGAVVRAREIARLDVSGNASAWRAQFPLDRGTSGEVPSNEPQAELTQVATGFTNADGLVTDAAGVAWFVDQAEGRIFRWSADKGLLLATDAIPQPVALVPARNGDLLVVARHGSVYSFNPALGDAGITVLKPQPAAPRPGATAWLPLNRWRDGHDWLDANTRRESLHYVSPDGSVFIPAPEIFTKIPASGGRWFGTIDIARAYAFGPARASEPFYVSDEFGQTTWRFTPDADGTLGSPQLHAEEGEAGTAVDAAGNVYVCAGQVFVYDPSGNPLGVIEVPERPSALAFAGEDRRTLLIAARGSLYAIRTSAPGR
jgi:hypothetical protein